MNISEYNWGIGSFLSHLLALFVLPVVLILWPFIALFAKWHKNKQQESVQIK
jgi:hypothetical protein